VRCYTRKWSAKEATATHSEDMSNFMHQRSRPGLSGGPCAPTLEYVMIVSYLKIVPDHIRSAQRHTSE
jgi:hypothetical protein